MERKFTSGSRQTPDPYDQYLEQNNYYRKHTAWDASSLFRVISEQMYDTQVYHLTIREKCVKYMKKYRQYFEGQVDKDFDEYLDLLSKPTTHGTTLELQAVSYMFQRSVIVFEPYNLGYYLNHYYSYVVEVFRVFYSPETHFDSVYPMSYIEEAAKCQSLVYEVLYRNVFNLPDITFAVEEMLHPNISGEFETETDSDGYTTSIYWPDGRRVELDLPQNTNCILENHKYCHFHYNYFLQFSRKLLQNVKDKTTDESELLRMKESFLPEKHISCVRQLLRQGISPFPFKVAKALDANMYRNIEFDAWSEVRREFNLRNCYNEKLDIKFTHYSTNSMHFQVGAKCHVKLFKSERDVYTCYVQEISQDKECCVVYIEQLGERCMVPYYALKPFASNRIQPRPHAFHDAMQKYSGVQFTRQYNYRYKFGNDWYHHHEYKNGIIYSGNKVFGDQSMKKNDSTYIKGSINQYLHLENFPSQTVQYYAMPLTTVNDKGFKKYRRYRTNGENANRCTNAPGANRNNVRTDNLIPPGNCLTPRNNQELYNNESNVSTIGNARGSTIYMATTTNIGGGHELVGQRSNVMFNGGAVYPYQGYYPMNTYAVMDEHFNYYDNGGLHAPPQPSTFLPLVNSFMPAPFYQIYNSVPNAPAPSPTHINSAAAALQPLPVLPSLSNGINPSLFQTYNNASFSSIVPACNIPNISNSDVSRNATSNVNSTAIASTSSGRQVHHNNLISRINFDAKKSVKLNGADLPKDIPTLRYFYNLGLDFYNKHFKSDFNKTSEDASITNNDSNAQTITNRRNSVITSTTKLDENPSKLEFNTIDSKNKTKLTYGSVKQDMEKSMKNINYSSPNNNSNQYNQHRYNVRYYKQQQPQKQEQTQQKQQQREVQTQKQLATFTTGNNGNQKHQSNNSSVHLNKNNINVKSPKIATTTTTSITTTTSVGAFGTSATKQVDYKESNYYTKSINRKYCSNNGSSSSIRMNSTMTSLQMQQAPPCTYIRPIYNDTNNVSDTVNSGLNPYIWNNSGMYYGGTGSDVGVANFDYNCENILTTSGYNGNLTSFATTTPGIYVPVPITEQMSPYPIPLASATANINVGTTAVNGGSDGDSVDVGATASVSVASSLAQSVQQNVVVNATTSSCVTSTTDTTASHTNHPQSYWHAA